MPPRQTELFWVDILISIEKVKRYTRDIETAQVLIENDIIYAATLRELEVIGEAIKHVLLNIEIKPHLQDNWREIVDFRNVLAHEYFGIDLTEIFDIVKSQIYEFEFDFHYFIHIHANDFFFQALESAKNEVKLNNWKESLLYLQRIEQSTKELKI